MCFTTPFLVIKGDCNDTADSTVVLNRLPGVSLKTAAKVANEDFRTGVNMLREFEEDAIERTRFDLVDALSHKYQFGSVIETERLGRRTDYYTEVAGEVGIQLKRDIKNGLNMSIQLPAIEVMVDTDVDTNLTINVDGVVTTQAVSLKANSTNHIDLFLEATDLIRVTWTPGAVKVGSISFARGGDCLLDMYACGGCIEARSVVNDGGEYVLTGLSSGIIADASCRVSECTVFSHYKREFAQLVRLQVGIKLMEELLISGRANPLVANGRDSARDLLVRWEGGVDPVTGVENPGEYRKRVKQLARVVERYLDKHQIPGFNCERLKLISSLP